MFTKKELSWLKGKATEDVIHVEKIEDTILFFEATGKKVNGEVDSITLTEKTKGKSGYAQHLFVTEFQQLEKYLLEDDVDENCEFKIQGWLFRNSDGTGGMRDVMTLTR